MLLALIGVNQEIFIPMITDGIQCLTFCSNIVINMGTAEFHKLVVDSVKLGSWVKWQRTFYTNYVEGKPEACTTQERIDQLESIGFEFKLNHQDQG